MERFFLSLLLLWSCCFGSAGAQDLEFRQAGKKPVRFSLAQLKKQSPAVTVKLEGGVDNYWALPLAPLLSKAYGPKLYGDDVTYVFVCKDGYRAPVKAGELQKFSAYLAFATSDGRPFQRGDKKLAPFYLIWDSQRYPQRTREASWPYQVVAVERASFSQAYAKVLPPPKASPQVMRGFGLFRKHCLSCHQINGQGGSMAIDLNAPFSVTEYIQKPYLAKLIEDPSTVRHGSTMPALKVEPKLRKQAIQDIIAYLESKARQRRGQK